MQRFDIKAREKENEVAQTENTDFIGQNPRPISIESILSEPGWVPYAFDGTDFTLTRTPGADLANSAFVYVTQFNDATEFATVSAAEMLALTENLPMPDMVLIYSIGRCGTTLANHVLNASDEIWCLSEPDVIDQVAQTGNSELICAVAKLLFAGRTKPDARALGVKFRSMSLFDADKFNAALPDAKNIFMYRDAVAWGNSFYTVFWKLGFTAPYEPEGCAMGWEILTREPFELGQAAYPDLSGDQIEPGAIFSAFWQRHLAEYTKHKAAGIDMYPIRYNEFNSDREAGVSALFKACGLKPISVKEALSAFENDSQSGTFMEQVEKPEKMNDAQKDFLREVLAKHSKYGDPDLILDQ